MSTIRIPKTVHSKVYAHLFSRAGEHFAFLVAQPATAGAEPIFLVQDAILIPDSEVTIDRTGWEISTEAIVSVVNQAVRTKSALIEIHNHGGVRPRFSSTDRDGLPDFSAYILDSLPGRPYAATVWGDTTVYAEYFSPTGETGAVRSITVIGDTLQQVVSRDNDMASIPTRFQRQLPWFTPEGQRQLGRLRVAVVGAGGTGSQVAQNLVYLGVRDFVLVEDDNADDTNMNRLVTATAADIETPKAILARRLIKSVAPDATVTVIPANLQSAEALTALKDVDVLFGCIDNDGARLILNELAIAYCIPYFDLGVGIDIEEEQAKVENIGGRVAVVMPGGPCLYCMNEIDVDEARYFLSNENERAVMRERGYVRGLDVPAPSVVSLNGLIAAAAVNELAVLVSGLRPVYPFTEYDLLGSGRRPSQWLTPRTGVSANPACILCVLSAIGDRASIERYARTSLV